MPNWSSICGKEPNLRLELMLCSAAIASNSSLSVHKESECMYGASKCL